MEQQQPKPPSPYFLEVRPNEPHARLQDARVAAGRAQYYGHHRSIPILQDGEVVDIKRY